MNPIKFERGQVLYHPLLGKVAYYDEHPTLLNILYVTKGAARFQAEMQLLSVRPWPLPVWDATIPDGLYAVQVANTWAVRRAQGGMWYMVDAKKQATGPHLKETVSTYMKIE